MSLRINTADKPLLVSRSAAHSAIGDALRLYIGRGRRYSVKQVANATGVKDRAIECAMCDPDNTEWRALSFEAIVSLASFLGEDFASEFMALAFLGCFALPEPDDTPPGALAVDNSDDAANLNRLAYGKDTFGPSDKAVLKVVAHRMVSRGAKLARMAA